MELTSNRNAVPKKDVDELTAVEGWTVLVLAGARPEGDPLAAAVNAPMKALIKLHEKTLFDYVVEALLGVASVKRVVVMAQGAELLARSDSFNNSGKEPVSFVKSGSGIAASIEAIAGSAKAPWPLLVTTADNALLTSDRVQIFLDQVEGVDIAIGVGERSIVERDFPETSRTWLRFFDGQFSGANLFALSSARCKPALRKWAEIEEHRKKGLQLVASFGPMLLIRTLTRTITFPEALERAATKLGCTAKPIVLDAEAPIDVDKFADLELVERILAARVSGGGVAKASPMD